MPLSISLNFAGVLALVNLWLAYRCVRIRLKGPGGVGDLGIPVLHARMRAHANFVEYTPFVLILTVLLEYTGGSHPWLQGLCVAYVVGRILHAMGIERPRFTMQFVGALMTWVVMLALALCAIWQADSGFREIFSSGHRCTHCHNTVQGRTAVSGQVPDSESLVIPGRVLSGACASAEV